MKKTLLLITILLISAACFAQTTPANLYGFGASFNNGASVPVAGSGLYAHSLTDGTYAFGMLDVLPNTVKPFTVTTNLSTGIAQKVFTVGSVPIYVPTSAGVSFSGSNTGWSWSTGGMAVVRIKKTNWYMMPNIRVAKSSVSGGTGYQPIFGAMFGWGN